MDPASPAAHSLIHLTGLALPAGVTAPTGWGAARAPQSQPASLDVRLRLPGSGFRSAARADALDASTVHYGVLAKRVRAAASAVGEGLGAVQALETAFECVRGLLPSERTGAGGYGVRVDVRLEKAAMFGDGVRVWGEREMGNGRSDSEGDDCRSGFVLEGVRLMVLVGVNAHERTARQAIVAEVECGWSGRKEEIVDGLFGMERLLVEIVDDTAFETLESLVLHIVRELQRRLLRRLTPQGWVRLRLAKPRAVAFAEAPAVEVLRYVTVDGNDDEDEAVAAVAPTLKTNKPHGQ